MVVGMVPIKADVWKSRLGGNGVAEPYHWVPMVMAIEIGYMHDNGALYNLARLIFISRLFSRLKASRISLFLLYALLLCIVFTNLLVWIGFKRFLFHLGFCRCEGYIKWYIYIYIYIYNEEVKVKYIIITSKHKIEASKNYTMTSRDRLLATRCTLRSIAMVPLRRL